MFITAAYICREIGKCGHICFYGSWCLYADIHGKFVLLNKSMLIFGCGVCICVSILCTCVRVCAKCVWKYVMVFVQHINAKPPPPLFGVQFLTLLSVSVLQRRFHVFRSIQTTWWRQHRSSARQTHRQIAGAVQTKRATHSRRRSWPEDISRYINRIAVTNKPFIHSLGICRMRRFLAVLRSFFHSSLLCNVSCHTSPPTIRPSSLTSSCHLFLGLPLNLVFGIFIYNTLLGILFSSILCTTQTNVIYLNLLSLL